MNKFFFLFLLISSWASAQQRPLGLDEAIQRAQAQSPSYSRAINLAENRYWNYRQYKASFLPQLNLSGTFPQYSRAIDRVTQDDGTFDFRSSEQVFYGARLSLDQNIGWTGGQLSLSSNLQRTDVYEPVDRLSYFSTPISVSYFQPMLLYNDLKWRRRINPLLYQESQRRYSEDLEDIAREATDLYFNALSAAIRKKIAGINVENNDTVFKISIGRYNLGKIAENDLLQIELNKLNAESAFTQAELQYQVAVRELKRYLGFGDETELSLDLPFAVPTVTVDVQKALAHARDNRAAVLEFRRRRIEAEQSVAQARGNTNYNVNIRANFGVSRQTNQFGDAYIDPFQQQQSIVVGLNIPLIDWGQAKAQIKKAQADRALALVNIEQDEINFEQEIFLQVMQFNAQYQQLAIAAKADTVAQKRYLVAKQRYLTGKISITDFNIAQAEKDQARLGHVNALRTFWRGYYTLRRLTLYDFVADRPIRYEATF